MSLELSAEIIDRVNGALAGGHPMIIGAVGAEGRPRLSFRGSIQVYSADQLGFWARRTEGATLASIRINPHVALMLRIPEGPVILQFAGRARETTDPEERARVFEKAPEIERRSDPERKGAAVIIDLDGVEGLLGVDADGQRRFVRLTRD